MRALERLRNPAAIAHPLLLVIILALVVWPIWHQQVIHVWPVLFHVGLCGLLLTLTDRKLPRLACVAIGVLLGLQVLYPNAAVYWVPAALVLSVLTPASDTERYPSRAQSGLMLMAGAASAGVVLQVLVLWAAGELDGFLQGFTAEESASLEPVVWCLNLALAGLMAQAIGAWKSAPTQRNALQLAYLASALVVLILNPAAFAGIRSSVGLLALFVVLYTVQRRTARPEPRLDMLPDTDRLRRWYDSMIARSQFPRVRDIDNEYRLLNAIRIAVGLIALWRTLRIAYVEYYGGASLHDWPFDGIDPFAAVAAQCALLACFTIGLQAPLVTLVLIPASTWLDLHLRTYTLGTNVLVLLLLGAITTGAGGQISLDAWVMRRFPSGWWASWNRRLYAALEYRDPRDLTRIYFLLFLGYAFTSFGAVLFHISDSYWVHGRTVQVLFTNSYLSRFYEHWRALERAAPNMLWWFSSATLIGQTIFQVFMVPLMFFRNGRRFVVFWGWNFAIASAAFLQLSYLPWLEMCLWCLLFSRPGPKPDGELATSTVDLGEQSSRASSRLIVTAWSVLLVLFVLKFPYVDQFSRAMGLPLRDIRRVTLYSGLDVPIVFNREDLTLGDAWPVIHRLSPEGEPRILPLNGIEGERLWYHWSDCCYFGNSLKWRRGAAAEDLVAFNEPEMLGYELVTRIIDFDYRRHGFESPVEYAVTVLRTRSSDVAVADPELRYAREVVLQYVLRRRPDGMFCRTDRPAPALDISEQQPLDDLR